MADNENTNMEVDDKKPFAGEVKPLVDEATRRKDNKTHVEGSKDAGDRRATREYCEQLQAWIWQYYSGYVTWQSCLAASSYPCYLQSASGTSTTHLDFNSQNWHSLFGVPLTPYPLAGSSPSSRAGEPAGAAAAVPAQPQQHPQENGNARRPGKGCTPVNTSLY